MYFEEILEEISRLVWGNYLMFTLIGTGIFFTVLTRGIQFRGFILSLKELLASIKDEKTNKLEGEGTVSAVKALCTALSSCMGNGNIVGVATAIASGGPGAVFWMWTSGVLGMATKYAEILIGIVYREKGENGNYVGGPMYYLSKGLGWKKMGSLFALLMLFQISGGALIQSNAVSLVLNDVFQINPLTSGVIMSIVILSVINGGIKRLASVSEFLVPVMSLIYLTGGLIIIISNINALEYVIISIVKSAFNFTSISGGVLGYSVKQAMRFGLARGVYSNEAGEGSAPVLHSAAITTHPARQGLFGIIEVFIDTIIMCSFTAFIVLTSGVHTSDISPALYVVKAFSSIHFTFKYIIGISMTLFAFSSILAQWYFGSVTLTYLFNSKVASYFKYIFVLLAILGSISSLKSVWLIQDILLGIMILPNLVGILFLHKDVDFYTKDYFEQLKNKKEINQKYVSDR